MKTRATKPISKVHFKKTKETESDKTLDVKNCKFTLDDEKYSDQECEEPDFLDYGSKDREDQDDNSLVDSDEEHASMEENEL